MGFEGEAECGEFWRAEGMRRTKILSENEPGSWWLGDRLQSGMQDRMSEKGANAFIQQTPLGSHAVAKTQEGFQEQKDL